MNTEGETVIIFANGNKEDIYRHIQFLEDEGYLFKRNKLDSDGNHKTISRVQAY